MVQFLLSSVAVESRFFGNPDLDTFFLKNNCTDPVPESLEMGADSQHCLRRWEDILTFRGG